MGLNIYAALLGRASSGSGGGGSGVLSVMISDTGLDKTWQEIYDAMMGGKIAVVYNPNELDPDYPFAATLPIISAMRDNVDGKYYVELFDSTYSGSPPSYVADTPDDYPTNPD